MLATINTKSNYRNLNGRTLLVKEIVGRRVTCMVFMPEVGKFNPVDFTIDECYITSIEK
jgi:hypothetical protein